MDYVVVYKLLFRIKLWLSVTICHVQFGMFNPNILYLNSLNVPYLLDLIRSSLTNRPTQFLPGNLSEFSLVPYFLFLIIFLDSGVLPFTSIWKMVKNTPNHISKNMIG